MLDLEYLVFKLNPMAEEIQDLEDLATVPAPFIYGENQSIAQHHLFKNKINIGVDLQKLILAHNNLKAR
uniref:Uncharacterized protein n=1 Tax=Oryza glumipatula TaxID=40148 RepID=A0A0E0AAN2_9ORYZ